MAKCVGFVVIFATLSTLLMAGLSPVPEIDAATGSSALAIVAGALKVTKSTVVTSKRAPPWPV